jgi:hypothetical protein
MSFYHTTTAVRNRTKTHTLRAGWKHLRPGARVQAVVKARGVKVEDLQILAQIEIVSVHRRPLNSITAQEVEDEGFPGWPPAEFIAWYCTKTKCQPSIVLRFIRFTYLD